MLRGGRVRQAVPDKAVHANTVDQEAGVSLRIVVCVKYVPDAAGDRGFAEDHTTDRESADGLLSELDEYAVEQALQIASSQDEAEVTVLTMGPDDAKDALRRGLSMGADKAVHIEDEDLHGTDAMGSSLVLTKAIEHVGYDLVLCGMASTDGAMGVLPAMLAERLGVPQATLLSEVSLQGQTVHGRRDGDAATEQLETTLPAVVSVTDQSGEARYPSFKGIMAAKKKPVEALELDDLDIDTEQVGLDGAWTTVQAVDQRPPRQAGTLVTDEGEGGKQLAEYLATSKLL